MLLIAGACRAQGSATTPGPAEPTPSTTTTVASTPPETKPAAESAPSEPAEPEASTQTSSASTPEPSATPPASRPPRPAPASVDPLARPSTSFVVLLVPRAIRDLPFAAQLADLVALMLDLEAPVTGGFDLLADLDHVVIASPDVGNWTQTVLAFRYRGSKAKVQAAIERGAAAHDEQIEWITEGGQLRANPRPKDPAKPDVDRRWFVFLDNKVLIYAREEFLPRILAGPTKDGSTSGDFVARMARPRALARAHAKAGLWLSYDGLRHRIKSRALPFEAPDRGEIAVSASAEPVLTVQLEFADADQAKRYERWWSQDLRQMIDNNLTIRMQLGWIRDLFKISPKGSTVSLRGTLTADQAAILLSLATDAARKFNRKVTTRKPKGAADKSAPEQEAPALSPM